MTFDESLAPDLDPSDAAASPTAELLQTLSLYGHRPHGDEPDGRPLPDPEAAEGALTGLFNALPDLLA